MVEHNNLAFVQMLRASAAIAVVLLHIIHEAESIFGESVAICHKLSSFPFGAGVDLFFVISGFVMIVSSWKLFGKRGNAWRFLMKRWIRIIPAYWVATALVIGIAVAYPPGLNSGQFGIADYLRSLFFIPYLNEDHVFRPILKLGWTLNYEMFFYICLSTVLIFDAVRALKVLTMGFGGLILIGQIFYSSASPLLTFWSDPIITEFIMGAWLGWLFMGGRRISGQGAISITLIAFVLLMLRSPYLPYWEHFNRLIFWGLPSALLFFALVFWRSGNPMETRVGRSVCLIGDASYVLYLFHPFVMRFFKQTWLKAGLHFPADIYVYISASLVGSVAISIFLYLYAEKPACRWLRGYFLKTA